MKRTLLVLTLFVVLGANVALAHATLVSSEPLPETAVTVPLEEVRLNFSEAVELDFSLFKVYGLDATGVDMEADNAWQRLNGLAGPLVSDALASRNDSEARVDTGLANDERRSAEVVLALREDLEPGVYVVMWRVLSVDTHGTQEFYLFEYAPQEQP